VQERASHRHVSHGRVSRERVSLVGFSRGPLSWASHVGLIRGHASAASGAKPVPSASAPKACVLCLRPKSLCPLPPFLPLLQSLGAPSAHCLSRAIMLFYPGAARGSIAGVGMCR
jgi:hypothetical protein